MFQIIYECVEGFKQNVRF